MPRTASGSRTNSTYASSTITRTSCGTRSRKRSSSACRTTVPVGLFGVQTKIRRVRSVIASAIASRSWRLVVAQRHLHGCRAADDRHDRVGLERPPGEEHLVAGARADLHDLLEQAHRPRAQRQVLAGHAVALGERVDQRRRRGVGVAVDHRGAVGDRRRARRAAAGRGSRCSRACTASAPTTRPAGGRRRRRGVGRARRADGVRCRTWERPYGRARGAGTRVRAQGRGEGADISQETHDGTWGLVARLRHLPPRCVRSYPGRCAVPGHTPGLPSGPTARAARPARGTSGARRVVSVAAWIAEVGRACAPG